MATARDPKADELRDKVSQAREEADKKFATYLATSNRDAAYEWCAARQKWLDAQKEYDDFLRSQPE